MNKYYFQGVSEDGKTIEGTLEAGEESEAREKLANARLAILTLEFFDPEKHKVEEGFLFEFRGSNDDGDTIKGTITAPNKYEAYVRLKTEYDISLEVLIQADRTPDEKNREKEAGLADLQKQWKEEQRRKADGQNGEGAAQDEAIVQNALLAQEQEKSFLSEQFGPLAKEVQEALDLNDLFLNPEKKRLLKSTISQIEIIKQSNNVAHLEKMVERLFDSLSDDQLFLPLAEIDPDLQKEYERSKKNFLHLVSKLKQDLQKGLKSLQKSAHNPYSKLNNTALLHVAMRQGYVTALVFLFLGTMALVGGFLGKFLRMDGLGSLFDVLGTSLAFWYFLVLSALVVVLWALDLEGSKTRKAFLKCVIGAIFFVIFSLNAPTLFFWTI
ncbi:MAG TPA: hypothetical protein VIT68_02295 [Candidatus Gracilibacteria bacterium]